MSVLTRFYNKHGTTLRIAVGQTSLLVTLLLLAAFIGVVPDSNRAVLEGRVALAEAIAVNSSVFITRDDVRRMEATLQMVLDRNPDILSAAVRSDDDLTIATVGEHESHWRADGNSNAQLVVPIWEGDNPWGQVELRFEPLTPGGPLGFFYQPTSILIGFMGLSSFLFFFLYLRRMLKDLDPSQAIPGRVRSALDTMAEGLLVLDAKQNIVLANEAFAKIVGVDAGDLLGRDASIFKWFNQDGTPMEKAAYPWTRALSECSMQRNQPVRLELGGDGEQARNRTFQTNCSPVLGTDDKAGGVLISFDDITELEEKERQLRQSKMEAEQANRAKSDFLANMSHEIRTPMTAIMGFTEVLRRAYTSRPDAAISSDNLRHLNTIANSGQHLLDLINDILDLSKVEAGRVEVEHIPCAVHEIIQDVVHIMRIRAEEKGLALEFLPEGPLPESIQSDPARIRQILINLVGNAVKFTEQGGIKIVTRMCETAGEPMLQIEVHDTGVGMSKAQASDIFSPFIQADSSITRRFGGTGLGLSICSRFAEAMGGDVTVESEPGQGSVFTTTIPARQVAGTGLLSPEVLLDGGESRDDSDKGTWRFAPASVLVVDDSPENRELLTLVLTDMGLDITVAGDGEEALEKLSSATYDLVIMDVQMPVMDGYTAATRIRERGLTLPVIALTAHAMKGAEERCLQAGYSGYLSKPIDFEELTQRLAQNLDGDYVRPAPAQEQGAPFAGELADEAANGPIYSSLSGDGNKYDGIILRFVDRLQQQIADIQLALAVADYAALQDLGHWLKGSAGSVGFHDFDEAGQELEALAKAQDQAGLTRVVGLIARLGDRVAAAYASGGDGDEESPPAAPRRGRRDPAEPRQSAGGTPAVTSGKTRDARLQPMIRKFAQSLPGHIDVMEQALDARDMALVAEKAHWLKGTAGTVGFHDFTEPAAELQKLAESGQQGPARESMTKIRNLCERIELKEAAEAG